MADRVGDDSLQRLGLVLEILLVTAFGRSWPVAQPDGHAEISRPASGDTVAGVVTILGSASSSEFDHYELSFGYDPNPTGTWFSIGEPVTTQVSFGRLGLWDTSRITDGTYALRLTVALDDGREVEEIVGGIEVRRSTSGGLGPVTGTTSPTAEPAIEGPISGPATATVEPEVATAAGGSQPRARGRGIDVATVTLVGAGAAVLALLGLAGYVEFRRSMRRRWGAIRSRRLHGEAGTQARHRSRRP